VCVCSCVCVHVCECVWILVYVSAVSCGPTGARASVG